MQTFEMQDSLAAFCFPYKALEVCEGLLGGPVLGPEGARHQPAPVIGHVRDGQAPHAERDHRPVLCVVQDPEGEFPLLDKLPDGLNSAFVDGDGDHFEGFPLKVPVEFFRETP